MIVRNVADTVLEFAEGLNQNNLHSSSLPRFEDLSAEQPESSNAALPAAGQPQEAQPMAGEPQEAQPIANQPQQAQPIASEPQQAQPIAGEPQEAQPIANQPQQAQPQAQPANEPQADDMNIQTADVTQGAEAPKEQAMPVEQGQAAMSHLSSYEQRSYDPGPLALL